MALPRPALRIVAIVAALICAGLGWAGAQRSVRILAYLWNPHPARAPGDPLYALVVIWLGWFLLASTPAVAIWLVAGARGRGVGRWRLWAGGLLLAVGVVYDWLFTDGLRSLFEQASPALLVGAVLLAVAAWRSPKAT